MFEWFTAKAINAIQLAQEESRRTGHNYIGTEQILLGLINLRDGLAFKTLNRASVTGEAARFEVTKIVPNGSDTFGKEIPFTPRAKRLLELSWDEARLMGHNYIGTEHLLLGLLREGEGIGPRVLRELGLNLAELRRDLLETMAEGYKAAVALDPSNMHAHGSAGRAMVFLEKYAEAYDYFSKALQLPGGEFYKADAEACRQYMQNAPA